MNKINVLNSHDINKQKQEVLDGIGYLQYVLLTETPRRDKSNPSKYFYKFFRDLKTRIQIIPTQEIGQTKKHSVEFAQDVFTCYVIAVHDELENILPTLETPEQTDEFYTKLVASTKSLFDYIQKTVFGSGMGFSYPYRAEQFQEPERILQELFGKEDFEMCSVNYLNRVHFYSKTAEEVINIFKEINNVIENKGQGGSVVLNYPTNNKTGENTKDTPIIPTKIISHSNTQ